MALHAVNPLSPDPEDERRQDAPVLATCPICEGKMDVVYNRNNQQVVVCEDCHSGLTVPNSAWEVVRIKRQAKPRSDR
jgi:ssDNA-binding Zn-finger/Zn-ribbon topoisomerase 1